MGDVAIFKVFFKVNDTVEVKKFSIEGDTSVMTNFYFMREKLQMVFPKLREYEFKITWRDSDGDDIVIENDEDLIFAFTEMEDPLKILYVTASPPNYQRGSPQFSHPPPPVSNVVCDICNKRITSYRYKCLQCYDYDLCADCEHAGHHSQHVMLRTSTPELPFARCGRRIYDQVNKAVKKANHMAYKEYKKRCSRGDRKRCDQQQQSEAENAGESSARRESKEQPQSCPFEEYLPNLYPLIDAIATAANNTASAAANAASSAANVSSSTTQTGASEVNQQEANAQAKSAPDATQEQNPTAQFMEAIRSVINTFAGFPQQPKQSNVTQHEQSQQTQQTPTAPKAAEVTVDLTGSTADEPMDIAGSQREPGWTLLSSEEVQQQCQFPLLAPTIVPTPEPANPVFVPRPEPANPGFGPRPEPANFTFVPPQSVQQPVQTMQQPVQPIQQSPQPTQPIQSQPNPLYPVLTQQSYPRYHIQDPRIAQGLSQLLEMGFSDEPGLIALLRRFDSNVDEVIKHIFENK